MASFNDKRRGEGPKRRLDDPRRRRASVLAMERLENRRLLTGGGLTPGGGGPTWHPTDTNLLDAHNGPMANLGTEVVQAYSQYLNWVAAGAKGSFTPTVSPSIVLKPNYIGLEVRGYGSFSTFVSSLQADGFTVTSAWPQSGEVDGYAPYAALPQIAEQAQTIGGGPIYPMSSFQQGISPNQADVALNVAKARATYGLTGAGQAIGVLSTDDGTLDGGMATSIKTGDLPPNVITLDDSSGTTDDEGRAMLEQIYDLAPAAQLLFATGIPNGGAGGDAAFAANILKLYNAGARVIVDDLGSLVDPYYQDGIIQQAINTVVAGGATYLSSAGNESDAGYESPFRGVTATVSTLGSGTYQNFDPSGATQTTQLGINVYTPNTAIGLQYDQPFYTANGVTSNVELDILNAAGTVVQQVNTTNNVAQQLPYQVSNPLPVGLYTIAVKVDSGPSPGHIFFLASGDGGFSVDTKFGSAGATYYPSTTGHNSGAETISVGAVPFWSTPSYAHTPSLDTNEPFSSTGPVYKEFAGDGTALPVPQLLLKPDLSATDANNTSFFAPGEFLDTSNANTLFPANPPYPGDLPTTFANPTTPTNQSVPTLENFTGTSSAAPNLAAIVALMKESNSSLTRNNILQDLELTTSPLDGQTPGVWNVQAGYGLANAQAAIAAAQVLKVVSIVPGNNATITSVPTFLTVTFNQPVNIATLSAANLLVIGANGSTVTVGAPIGVDSPTDPSVVVFPISIIAAPGRNANGIYKDAIIGPGITSESGVKLTSPIADQFNLQDTNGPRVASTKYLGRVVTIQFNQALNPATVNASNIFVFRDGGVNNPILGAGSIAVSELPGATFSYNPATFTATIDMTGVPQSSLPTDHYGIFVSNLVTDVLNNPLNGAFSGLFPSGTTPEAAGGSFFFQDLGVINLKAPIITTLTLAPGSDSGIVGDNNTKVTTPSVVGQVTASFPGAIAGLLVYAEFNGINHNALGVATGGLDLGVGSGGRGYLGHFDVQTTTNAQGQFVINYPPGVTPLPDGLNQVRVVVVGQPDLPPLPGLSSVQNTSFRIDTSDPIIAAPPAGGPATSIVNGEQLNTLSTLTLNFADPVNPQTIGSPFAVPATFNVPALNPTTASNVSSYGLFLVNGVGQILVDESKFITSATFASTSSRVLTSDPFTASVTLAFGPGLPAGSYAFLARSSAYGTGLSDAAGNPFVGGSLGTANYLINFTLQPTPAYITGYTAYTVDPSTPGGFDTSGARAYYELPVSGVAPRASAPPSLFSVDFSNTLPATNAAGVAINYSNDVELVGSGLTGGLPSGNFGDLGITNTSGFTTINGLTVILTNSVPGAVKGQYGYDNRLLIELPAGFSLPANYYRVYLPNTATQTITDVFGNQLDGEFDGYQNASGYYVNKLQNGTIRGTAAEPDLSGDGNAGGAFMTGFEVVPNGNVIYARADAIYNPLIPSETPNGSASRPYPVLAPEAVPNGANGGDLNSPVNAGANFDPTYDRSGDGVFEPSAFFAAQQALQQNGGPVVVVAEPSIPTLDPSNGQVIQKSFILQAPNPSNGQVATIANDASAAVPALTTLVFQAGTTLKMQNAALLVQNQGSALEIGGGANPGQAVVITSYKDSSVGGVSNGDPNSAPAPGDYGGIVFRNFSQAAIPGEINPRNDLFPGQIPITGTATEDQRLKGQFSNLNDPNSQADAVSGADDVMSSISFLTERYAGGVVPQTIGTQYDGITLLNSRPAIVNSTISDSGSVGSAVAGISVDVDALRSDDVAQGPLIRNVTFSNNGLNGIYIRANSGTPVAEPTDAVAYPTNPTGLGGAANYVLNDPYPYLLTSRMRIGTQLQVESGADANTTDRLDVIPGMLVKFETGAWLEIGQDDGFGDQPSSAASLVVGDPTYIREFDNNNLVNPSSPGFVANSANLPKVIFTSFLDTAATTAYTNPFTGVTTTIVAPLPTFPAGAGATAPGKANWGGIQLDAGTVDTINGAVFEYGGGQVNTPAGYNTLHALEVNRSDGVGAFISVTNNTFLDNADVPINTTPNAWVAGDPAEPLNSGAPFIHGNMFVGNDYNGVGVVGGTSGFNVANVDVNSNWIGGDFTYFVRDTIILGPSFGGIPTTPSGTQLVATPTPNVVLTLESNLPGTVLADGTVVPAPGAPLVIKLLNKGSVPPTEANLQAVPANAVTNSYVQGAGFVVGIDNGIDPPADQLVDPGAFSELRITGIGANQTTGQSRVPVVITSAYNDTVGTTVNGVTMNQLIPGNTTKPAQGDGGVIYFGANSLTTYNLTDPRYGSIIDNADISDITRIEQQGGGIVYGPTASATSTTVVPTYADLFGLPLGGPNNFADQYNAPKQLTVSDSNFNQFSSAGFWAHPGPGNAIVVAFGPLGGAARATGLNGEPTHDYFYNDTFSNMPVGIAILSQSGAGQPPFPGTSTTPFVTPAIAVVLNDDFYQVATGISTFGPTGGSINAHVALLAMDDIFDGSTVAALNIQGLADAGTENLNQNHAQTFIPAVINYDDFYNNAANLIGTYVNSIPSLISNAYNVDPQFRNPANLNFFLKPTSGVIDAAESQLGPTIFGDMLYPMVTYPQQANATTVDLNSAPIRSVPVFVNGTLDQTQPSGNVSPAGGLGATFFYFGVGIPSSGAPYDVDYVTLPGRTYNNSSVGSVSSITYPDQWIAVTQASAQGTTGNTASPGTFAYAPVVGQRDQVGDLRSKDPNVITKGFGNPPYFDLGAFEYIVQNPPIVEGVAAETSTGLRGIYAAGGIAGINTLPSSIVFAFNEQLNPATLNGMSVILQISGDGNFVASDPTYRTVNLSGLLSFNNQTDLLSIDTSGIINSLATASAEYRIILKGTGSSVIRDNSGLALDGFNLDAAGNQLPLPSGSDQFPGSDFQVTFTIDTHPPAVVAGTFQLDPASDTSGGLNITNLTMPTFDGTITDVFPPTNYLLGQTVFIDISTQGNGIFDELNAGVGTTNAQGQFKVTLTKPVPDTPNKVGVNGIQEGPGSLVTFARVRVVDQSGNQSNLVTDPISSFVNDSALTAFQEDTVKPKVAAFSPLGNTVVSAGANGQIVFTATFTKNMKTSSLNANSILVYRTGGTGNFTNPVQVPIIAGSIAVQSYSTNPTTLGYETVTFAILGTQPNDEYTVILKGTGATPITDLAGNPLNGNGSGSGSDYSSAPIFVNNPSNAHLIYVGQAGSSTGTGTLGTRENPFPTIAAGLAAAQLGDDVLVLPGVYEENVTMKAGVRLISATLASTDTAYFSGSPYHTLIYGVATATGATGITTFFSAGSFPGFPTEVSGFSIVSPLIGDSNLGTISSTDVAIRTANSNITIDHDVIVNAGTGIYLTTTGSNAPTSMVYDNLIVGNLTGVLVSDLGATTSIASPHLILNNTIADNTVGLQNISTRFNYTQAYVINNIFYSNHDLTTQRNGTGIAEGAADTLAVGNNLFYQNGKNGTGVAQATGAFVGFAPSALTTTPDVFGNFIGNPYFNQAEDPRPNGDTPSVFFTYSNFDLTIRSAALNAADNALAPGVDFLYRTPVAFSGHGFPGTGPASIGAFYFGGISTVAGGSGTTFGGTTGTSGTSSSSSSSGTTSKSGSVVQGGGSGSGSSTGLSGFSTAIVSNVGGGIALGTKQFQVADTSIALIAPDATTGQQVEPGPAYIDVNFSDNVQASSVSPTDLILAGSGLGATNPAHATSFAWIDDHAIRFYLSGGYKKGGTVSVSIPQGAITDTDGTALTGFSTAFQVGTPSPTPSQSSATGSPAVTLNTGGPVAPAVSTATATQAPAPAVVTSTVLPVVQPIAAAPPVAAPAPTGPAHKLTAKEQKAEKAAQAKAEKAHKAAEAAQAKAEKAAQARAAKAAKAALKHEKS